MTITNDTWRKRIEAARDRREPFETLWQSYCKLHSDAEQVILNGDDDTRIIQLPNGDRVRLGLVFRNIEQTMGYLEMDDIGVTARATAYDRPLDNIDTNNESVVEQALYDSMKNSGLIGGPERLDRIKLDALLVGHGISFSWWKVLDEQVETGRIPVLLEKDGVLEPKTDKAGEPVYKPQMETLTLWEGMVDERISPLEFLCSSTCTSLDESHWLGFERIVRLDELKSDPRFAGLPADLKGGTYEIKTLQGERGPGGTDYFMEDSVKLIIVWDRMTRELITFLETSDKKERNAHKKDQPSQAPETFIRLKQVQYPVEFDNPQDSPFATYIPIPASDHPFGVSQVEHIRNPALESDMMHTRFANLSREQKRIWLYDKIKLKQEDVDDAINGKQSLAALGVDVQDGEDLSRIFKDIQTVNIPDSLLTAATLSEDIVRKNSGVAETPFGGTETATESENQMMIGQARVNRKRNKLFSFLEQLAQIHLAYLRTFAPDGSSIRVVLADGTDALLHYGREAFMGRFNIKVEPGGGATAISPVRQKMLIEAVGMVGNNMGPKASLLLFREVLTQMDIRNVNGILQAAREFMIPPAPPAAPAPGMPGGMPQGMPPSLPNPAQMTNPNQLGAAVNVTR